MRAADKDLPQQQGPTDHASPPQEPAQLVQPHSYLVSSPVASQPAVPLPLLPRVHVLVIEDEPAHADLLHQQLSRSIDWQVTVSRCSTLREALDFLSHSTIDAVLCDLHLPDSRGLQTLCPALDHAGGAPVLVLTSLDDTQFGYHAVRQGADDFLLKSELSPGLLMRTVLYAIERRRSRKRLRSYAEHLVRSNRDLENFVRFVSHDLKTPMAVIRMELEEAERHVSRPNAQAPLLESILSAREELDRATALIDNLLHFAHVTSKKTPPVDVDLNAVVQHAIDRALMNQKATDQPTTLSADPLPMLRGHTTLLEQLFENLLCNAIKYKSTLPPRIHVTAEPLHNDNGWHIRVIDNGRGVPDHDRQRIFTAFERASDNHAIECTGVGLAIAQRVAEIHRGRVYVTSNPTGGSIFHVELRSAHDTVTPP